MKITSIEPQTKNKDRLNLYIDGVFRCGLTVSTAARLGLYESKEVTEYEIRNIDTEDEYQKCMNSALNLVTRRMQSERELWQKLGKKYEKPLIGRCLDRLRELNYVDDIRFAEMWVRERTTSRGKRLLRDELATKGIHKDIIDRILAAIEDENEFETAFGLALHKYKNSSTREENYTRIMSLLTRKGYSYSIAKDVLGRINKTTD